MGAMMLAFVALTDEVFEGETRRIDRAVLRTVATVRMDWLDVVAREVTALGNTATLLVISLAACAILWAVGRRISVTLLLVSLGTGTVVMYGMKHLFDRPRPEVVAAATPLETPGFPSGHAMMAAVAYGTVAYLVGRLGTGRIRTATWVGAGLVILLIGLSRIYLGVHYPTDVLAGWLAGVGWTSLLVGIFHLLDAFSSEVPGLERVEARSEGG